MRGVGLGEGAVEAGDGRQIGQGLRRREGGEPGREGLAVTVHGRIGRRIGGGELERGGPEPVLAGEPGVPKFGMILPSTALLTFDSRTPHLRFLNALAPGAMAHEAQRLGAWFVHYSTDYVFDGSGNQQWTEADAPAPLNVYGKTKLEGEQLVAQHCAAHLIFRASWVYAARGNNFARTMLRLAQERERLSVIDDQYGAPTGADLIADVTAHAIRQVGQRPQDGGLYHLAAAGETTWHAYARHVLAGAEAKLAAQLVVKEVVPIPSSAFPTAARRPHNSRLNTAKLQTTFGVDLPAWQHGVDRMLTEILDTRFLHIQ